MVTVKLQKRKKSDRFCSFSPSWGKWPICASCSLSAEKIQKMEYIENLPQILHIRKMWLKYKTNWVENLLSFFSNIKSIYLDLSRFTYLFIRNIRQHFWKIYSAISLTSWTLVLLVSSFIMSAIALSYLILIDYHIWHCLIL